LSASTDSYFLVKGATGISREIRWSYGRQYEDNGYDKLESGIKVLVLNLNKDFFKE
jgi:hypothetical protein